MFFKETPPLARGRLLRFRIIVAQYRNTPARAGKTYILTTIFALTQKHPRSRGEDCTQRGRTRAYIETPPLARGRPYIYALLGVTYGNTPARAGKTSSSIAIGTNARKHPRSRGEDRWCTHQYQCHNETPPLARGRLRNNLFNFFFHRNTPARAGKTSKDCVKLNQKHKIWCTLQNSIFFLNQLKSINFNQISFGIS